MNNSQKFTQSIDKINYHFTNRCNYFCKHCFVDKCKPEIPLSEKLRVIDHISEYFQQVYCRGTINLVGGEPTLSPDFSKLVEHTTKLGISIGIVTNGTNLDSAFFDRYSAFIKEIGLSVDSLNPGINRLMGRCDIHGNVMTREKWCEISRLIKSHGIGLKINICLTKSNCHEDFINFLEKVKPDRFKIMVLSIVSGINDELSEQKPAASEVSEFVKRHASFNPVVENDGDMQNAYAMVNSKGMLVINDGGHEKEVKSLVDERLFVRDLALVDHEKFFQRYIGK